MINNMLRIPLLAFITILAIGKIAGVEQTVQVGDPGNPEGVGFNEDHGGLAWASPTDVKTLILHIQSTGALIKDSQVVDPEGPMWIPPSDNATPTSEKVWTTAPFLPKERYRARFIGVYVGGPGGQPKTWEAAVISASIDGDANNNSTAFQRPPAGSGNEKDIEDFQKRGADVGKPGLFIPVNNGYEEGGDVPRYIASEEDKGKAGIFDLVPDPDLVEGRLTLKLPNDVPGKANIVYNPDIVKVYLMNGANDFALVPSGTAIDVGPSASITPATTSNPDGAVLSFGADNILKYEAVKASESAGLDDMVVTLVPNKGKESHNRIAYTAIEANASQTKDVPSFIKFGKTAFESYDIMKKINGGTSIVDALKSEFPKFAWYAYIQDASSTTSEIDITLKSYDGNNALVDTLLVNGTGKIKQIAPGGKKYCSDQIWFIPASSTHLADHKNTIMVKSEGYVDIEYSPKNTTAKARKRLLVPKPETFLIVGVAGLGGGTPPNASGAWDLADSAAKGVTNNYLNTFYGSFGKVANVDSSVNISHWIYARSTATDAIKAWMREDISQGGMENRNVMIASISWGATNATSIAQWFEEEYGFKVRLQIMVEGVARFGGPYGQIGPALIKKNYYASELHYPRGAAIPDCDNFAFSLVQTEIANTRVPRPRTTPSSRQVISGQGTLHQIWLDNRSNGPFHYQAEFDVVSNDLNYINDRSLTQNTKIFGNWSAHIAAEWAGTVKGYSDVVTEGTSSALDH